MNRPFAPNFLKKYDDYLLKNKPELYSTRFHWVLYYGLITIAIVAALFTVIPNDARGDSPIFMHTCIVVIIGIIGLIIWLIFLLRFNVFKRFGNITAIGRLSVFWLYFLCSVIILWSCFVPSVVETLRANYNFKEQTLIKDLNTINTAICKLEYDSLKQNWSSSIYQANNYFSAKKDTVIEYFKEDYTTEVEAVTTMIDSVESYSNDKNYDIEDVKINKIDYYNLLNKLQTEDSSVKINDSTFIFYNCPPYKKVSAGSYRDVISNNSYTNFDLYKIVFQHPKPINKAKEWQTLKPLLEKYSYEFGSLNQYKTPTYQYDDTLYLNRLQKKYNIYTIENNYRNIIERKYRFSNATEIQVLIRLIFYPSLIFSLLLFVFRHSTTKTFFLSILSGFLLFILAAIITAFSGYYDTTLTVFSLMLLYFLIFSLGTIFVFNSKTRLAWQGISINLFTWMVYFLPLIATSWYYSNIQEPNDDKARDIFIESRLMAFITAEVICPILFTILLATIIYKMYRKWYALPQE